MVRQTVAITEYIPQRPPFVMVDELVSSSETSAVTTYCVPTDNVLLTGNELPAAGLLENVAQTAAAWIGSIATAKNEPVRIGYVGAVKKMNIYRLPQVGETLTTTIDVVATAFDITLVSGTIKIGNELAAEMDLKIALQ